MSLKNPVTQPGIDPGTVRLLPQRLNHYATPGFTKYTASEFICVVQFVAESVIRVLII